MTFEAAKSTETQLRRRLEQLEDQLSVRQSFYTAWFPEIVGDDPEQVAAVTQQLIRATQSEFPAETLICLHRFFSPESCPIRLNTDGQTATVTHAGGWFTLPLDKLADYWVETGHYITA